MRLRGGYDVRIEGRPADSVEKLSMPESLYLPLMSRRFSFDEVRATDGQEVRAGDVLATDPANSSLPLLAPMGGVVRLKIGCFPQPMQLMPSGTTPIGKMNGSTSFSRRREAS